MNFEIEGGIVCLDRMRARLVWMSCGEGGEG